MKTRRATQAWRPLTGLGWMSLGALAVGATAVGATAVGAVRWLQ